MFFTISTTISGSFRPEWGRPSVIWASSSTCGKVLHLGRSFPALVSQKSHELSLSLREESFYTRFLTSFGMTNWRITSAVVYYTSAEVIRQFVTFASRRIWCLEHRDSSRSLCWEKRFRVTNLGSPKALTFFCRGKHKLVDHNIVMNACYAKIYNHHSRMINLKVSGN